MFSERKISFVLHEPDNESEGSSKSNVTIQGEEVQNEKEKKRIQASQSRPFLLRRGTTMGNTGSFKRRSLKLRRNTKEGKDLECDICMLKILIWNLISLFKPFLIEFLIPVSKVTKGTFHDTHKV